MNVSNDAYKAASAVDGDRLWNRHMEMAEIGAIANGGVNRQALSEEDIGARRLLLEWAGSRGFAAGIDDIGNIFIRREGRDPAAAPVVAGSHLDSQPQGGRFDGPFGVLAALEAIEALTDAGIETARPIDVVAWTNEEGSRFTPAAMGSATFMGTFELDAMLEATDTDGVMLKDALAATLAAAPDLARRPFNFPIAAYVEAHIEQGPILEDAGLPIGVVTGIQGLRWFDVEIGGETAHAGTTPLAGRRDAVQGAVRAVQALNELTADPDDRLRFTVGRFVVSPNSPNSVADRVRFTVDLRHGDVDTLERISGALEETCRAAAAPCDAVVRETFRKPPTRFAAEIVESIGRAAEALGTPSMRLPSGAFHDAGFLNEVCPAGMIFIPCRGGVSHNVAEFASPADVTAGARVLAATLCDLANRETHS